MSILTWGQMDWFQSHPLVDEECKHCGSISEVRSVEGVPVCDKRECRERFYREVDREGAEDD